MTIPTPTDALRLVPDSVLKAFETIVKVDAKLADGDTTIVNISRIRDLVNAAAPASPLPELSGWQDISTAPKDGTPILAWCVHPHARWAGDDRDWAAPVVTSWTTHNGGGWTWHGMIGTFTHWMPLPAAPTGDRP